MLCIINYTMIHAESFPPLKIFYEINDSLYICFMKNPRIFLEKVISFQILICLQLLLI